MPDKHLGNKNTSKEPLNRENEDIVKDESIDFSPRELEEKSNTRKI